MIKTIGFFIQETIKVLLIFLSFRTIVHGTTHENDIMLLYDYYVGPTSNKRITI